MTRQVRRGAIAVTVSAMLAVAVVGTASVALADDVHGDRDNEHGGQKVVRATLTGFEEDPLPISTEGEGTFSAKIDEKNQEIEYRLSYEDLTNVTQAHIHFAGRAQSGGIVAFLCSNLPNPPAGTPACPSASGTVTGTIGPADVLGPTPNQGIAAGEFDELVDAIQAGVTYANVHTEQFPGGEIRGQIDDGHHR